MKSEVRHPAVMGPHILEVCKRFLPTERCRILDPFAGVGTTARLLPGHDVVGIEIERDWALQSNSTIHGNSLEIIPTLGKFDVILTSPCYGNRMADDFVSKDSSRRVTYRHYLGKELSEGTASNLYFGKKNKKYENFHESIWRLCVDSLRDNGLFILNCKDFICNGEVREVTEWHVDLLKSLGMVEIVRESVYSKGMRLGANGKARVDYENVICLRKN